MTLRAIAMMTASPRSSGVRIVPTRRVDKPCESCIRPNVMWCWDVGLLVGLLSPQEAVQGVQLVEWEEKQRSGP
jgi:hypothetical protein